MKKIFLWIMMITLLYTQASFASNKKEFSGTLQAPQPTTCISGTFSKSGTSSWFNVALKITNNCGRDVDFQNSSFTFDSASNLNTSFWGNFSPLAYPDNPLMITSQTSAGKYISSFSLHFPEQSWARTVLHNNESITIQYGTSAADYDATSFKAYVNGTPVQTGSIVITNSSLKPTNITQAYALVDVIFNGQKINTVQVPWGNSFSVDNLTPGSYILQPQTLTDSQGNSYQGSAVPKTVTVNANQQVASTISYQEIVSSGSINVTTPALPSTLAGYTGQPIVTLTRVDTGAAVNRNIAWNTTSNINSLDNNATYTASTPAIIYNNNKCMGSFSPVSLVSKSTNPATTFLSYQCSAIAADKVTLNVSGLPSSVSSIDVSFQPSDGSAKVSKTVAISNGSGSDTINLTDGVVYSVSSTTVSQYAAVFNPQPLMAKPNVVESINYQKQASGRIIAYIPGWKTPPTAQALANAGYTHAMIAFGVFSTTSPGTIVSAFDTVTAAYIASLHQAGIKVILSLGGASSGIPDTTVNFHQVLTAAGSVSTFQQKFIASIESFVTKYGFDGIDIDIESGLTGSGKFEAPTGDVAALATILNALHQKDPNYLITLTPQVDNIAATNAFNETWGNYASLIMQIRDSLSWVEVQIYNTGCAYGIDQVCYQDKATSPDLSVAMATDLLENWPSVDKSGRPTTFWPYISYLRPDQVVLGYLAPNHLGVGDGNVVKPTSVIKRAVQCLRTGVISSTSCDTYVPPRVYPTIGGVFEWEITFDQDNNFKFATDLSACVKNGSC